MAIRYIAKPLYVFMYFWIAYGIYRGINDDDKFLNSKLDKASPGAACNNPILIESTALVNGLYYAAVTLTSIGFGDMVPKSNTIKLLTIGLMLLGYTFIYLRLSHLFDWPCSWVLGCIHDQKRKDKVAGISAFAALPFFVLFGTVMIHLLEKKDWIDALYLAVSCVTTVGYGDLHFDTKRGRTFAVIWMPTSTVLCAKATKYIYDKFWADEVCGLSRKDQRDRELQKREVEMQRREEEEERLLQTREVGMQRAREVDMQRREEEEERLEMQRREEGEERLLQTRELGTQRTREVEIQRREEEEERLLQTREVGMQRTREVEMQRREEEEDRLLLTEETQGERSSDASD